MSPIPHADERKTRIFLSYGRGDDRIGPDDKDENYYYDPARSFLKRLYEALVAAGLEVWWDRISLPHRELSFLHDIRTAVDAHDKVLLVVGPKGMESNYVRAEYEYALSICKPVVTLLRAGDYKLVPTALRHQNTLDFRDLGYFDIKVAELVDDLGAPPAPMGELYRVPRELPEWYVRRPEDLRAVSDLLQQDGIQPVVVSSKHKTVTLHGMGGIGKSTLANALALDCSIRRFFPDGVFWLELGKEPELATRMGDIGEAFGDLRAEYPDDQRAASRLSHVLQNKAVLIILDNVWDGAHAKPFKVVNSRCRLLITTRKPRLHTLLGGVEHELDTLNADEALLLFARRTGMDTIELSNEEAKLGTEDKDRLRFDKWKTTTGKATINTLKAISVELGGLALAVEIAAGKIGERGIAFAAPYLQHLRTTPDPFADLQLDENDKDHNVALSLKLSYDDLSKDLQRRFRMLGTFAAEGTFTAAAAAAVWDDPDDYHVENVLSELAQISLVTRTELTGETRNFQHPLLRAYSRALLERAAEIEDCFGRYADFVVEQTKPFETVPPGEWGPLEHLFPHVQAVGNELKRRWENSTALDSATVKRCGEFALNTSNLDLQRRQAVIVQGRVELRGLFWLKMGLEIAQRHGDQQREAMFLNKIGESWTKLSEYHKALDYHEQALTLFRAAGDRQGETSSLNYIGEIWIGLGEMHKALEFFDRALALTRASGDRKGEAIALVNVGALWALKGTPDTSLRDEHNASELFDKALSLARATGDRRSEAESLKNIGTIWLVLGEGRKALEFLDQALPLTRATGDRRSEAESLSWIGLARMVLGEELEARKFLDQALLISRAAGDHQSEADVLDKSAAYWFKVGEYRKAIDNLEQALRLVREMGSKQDEALTCLMIAKSYHSLGILNQAIQYCERCIELDALPLQVLEDGQQFLELLWRERDSDDDDNIATLPSAANLHRYTVRLLVMNTSAFKTYEPERFADWQLQLRQLRVDFAGRGVDFAMEVDFLDALLAILDDLAFSLPMSNPYANSVKRVRATIVNYQASHPHETT